MRGLAEVDSSFQARQMLMEDPPCRGSFTTGPETGRSGLESAMRRIIKHAGRGSAIVLAADISLIETFEKKSG